MPEETLIDHEKLKAYRSPAGCTFRTESGQIESSAYVIHAAIGAFVRSEQMGTEIRQIFDSATLRTLSEQDKDSLAEPLKKLDSALLSGRPTTKENASRLLATLYHILSHDEQPGIDARRAIEAAFTFLELGPIPPAQTLRRSAER